MRLKIKPKRSKKLLTLLCSSLLLIVCTCNCPSAQAQTKMPWDEGFKWPWDQQTPQPPPPPPPPPVAPAWRQQILDRAKKRAEQEKKRQQDMMQCPPVTTANPDQRGQSNDWKNFTNALGRTDSTSGHMRGYDGNQAYMGPGRAGTFETGGSHVTSTADTLNQSNYHPPTAPAEQTNLSGADYAKALGGRLQ